MTAKQSGRNDPCPCGSGKKYKKCCLLAKRDISSLYTVALEHRQAGDLSSAETLFREILDSSPGHADALHMLGLTLHQQGQNREAISLIKKAALSNPSNAEMHYNCGTILHGQKAFGEAAEYLVKALSLNADYALARENLSIMLMSEDFFLNAHWLEPEQNGKHPIIPAGPELVALIELLAREYPDIGKLAALTNFVQRLSMTVTDSVDDICLAILLRQLHMAGWYDRHTDWPRPLNFTRFMAILEHTALHNAPGLLLFQCLNYGLASQPEWNVMLYKDYFAPAIELLLENEKYVYAKQLNFFSLLAYGMQPHTSEQWIACEERIMPSFIRAAAELRNKYLSPSLPLTHTSTSLPVIAIVVELPINGSSGDKLLLSFLQGWANDGNKSVKPAIYAVNGIDQKLADIFSSLGVRVISFDPILSNLDYVQRMLSLREVMSRDHVSALVYVGVSSNPAILDGAFQLAPVQIYFSMGFRHRQLPFWDGFIAGGSPAKSGKWHGKYFWRTTPIPSPDTYPLAGTNEETILKNTVAQLRSRWSEYRTILGTLARAEKIDNPEFIGTLARILHANTDAVYLWFGTSELSSVRRLMEEHQISDRCIFMGWVNVEEYAKVLDVHLDSFPFCTALAGLTTMSAGTANVWMETQEARELAAWSYVLPLLEGTMGTAEEQSLAQSIYHCGAEGKGLALLAENEGQYFDYVQKLIDDPAFRVAVGQASKTFMQYFMHDARRAAQIFFSHVTDLIRSDDPENVLVQ